MPDIPVERIKQIKSFPSLVKFLRDELDWPLSSEEIDELVFEYEPDELGIDPEIAVKIKEIKQLRPLTTNQPWGIFYIGFEPKRLPVVVLRRVLQKLVIKKRQSAQPAHRSAWQLHDLLFISSYGEENQRAITFAHFSEDEESKLPTLRVIGWDSQDTPLHMDRCIHELQSLTFDEELSPDKWREQWSEAFTLEHREVITKSKVLAKKLAALATRIRQRVNKVLAVESEKGPIRQLYKAFQETLIHDLSEDDFADMYAQTITYGLFSTKKSRPAGLVAENLLDMIPKTNPFLKELLSTFLTVGGRKGKIDFDELGIDDVVQTLRNTDMDAVLRDFEDRNPLEDPVIHFYEGFLKEYDAKKKVKRGVFYTPRPVVSFIVRSVDEILRKDFGLMYGLADTTTWGEMARRNRDIKIPEGVSEHDPFVQILDPATGTGTFLVEVIDLIYKTMKSKWEQEGHIPLEFNKLWNEYIPKHLLPRLYGFELMMAPYAIAHMKIGLKLFETGYRFGSNERARIYLTNTLEKPKKFSEILEYEAPALAHEAVSANSVKKNTPITVIIGNPPYAGVSSNLAPEMRAMVVPYKKVDGVQIVEKSALQFEKNLNDDYVKFIRYTEMKLRNMPGIVGMITNNGFLETTTLRGMRSSLLDTFSNICVIDLHGDADKRETATDGTRDRNVFDIKHGVAISILRKHRNSPDEFKAKIMRCDVKGDRDVKYSLLLNSDISTMDYVKIEHHPPTYFFTPVSKQESQEYQKGISIIELFGVNSTGFESGKDEVLTDFSRAALKAKIKLFCSQRTTQVCEKFKIKAGWGKVLLDKRNSISGDPSFSSRFMEYLHRPFDIRYTYYRKDLLKTNSFSAGKHLCYGERNVALMVMRQVSVDGPFNHALVSGIIPNNRAFYSTKGKVSYFPLFLFSGEDDLVVAKGQLLGHNLNSTQIHVFEESLDINFKSDVEKHTTHSFGPRDVFCYSYAILSSRGYRERYSDFLRRDFPKVFVTKQIKLFLNLCSLGSELIELHLMESTKLNDFITTFPILGNNDISKVGEKAKALADVKNGKGRLFINKTQYFDGVPEVVWNFHIGGYQVCHKWLADRKKAGRKLSQEDIVHYHKIVVAINETIKIMKQIDETIDAHGGWPGAFTAK